MYVTKKYVSLDYPLLGAIFFPWNIVTFTPVGEPIILFGYFNVAIAPILLEYRHQAQK